MRKIIGILWSARGSRWEFRKTYDDGTLSAYVQTQIDVWAPLDYQDFQKRGIELTIMGASEDIADGDPEPSVLTEEYTQDGKKRLVSYLLRRLESLLVRLERGEIAPDRRISLLKVAFSVYTDLIDLGAKIWVDQLLEKHGIDYTKNQQLPPRELN